MIYKVIYHYMHEDGLPSWPGAPGAYLLLAQHDTEGGVGLQGGYDTLAWMVATAYRNASYHEFWCFDEGSRQFTVLVVLPADRAAGSVAPQPVSPTSGLPLYQPDAWVRESLGAKVWDPNQWIYACAVAGTVADVERWSTNPDFIAGAKRRSQELREALGVTRRAEHFRFNPRTRTDWGQSLTAALGGLVIPETTVPDTASAPPAPVEQEEDLSFLADMRHQIPKVVLIKEGSRLLKAPFPDAEVHWVVPAGEAFEAELFAGYGQYWMGRRKAAHSDGVNPFFFFETSAFDGILYRYEAPSEEDARIQELEGTIGKIRELVA